MHCVHVTADIWTPRSCGMEDKAIMRPLPWQWFPFRITDTRLLLGVSQLGVMWPALSVPLTGVKWTHDPGWLRKRPCGIRDILEIGHFQSHHPLRDVPKPGFLLSFILSVVQAAFQVCVGTFDACSCFHSLSPSAVYCRVCWVLPASHAKKDFKLYFYSLYYSFESWEWWG